ncbi:TonB-dependent receptor [Sinomicrobium weinanense]|uniref:TonB-dependent receptor n=1 Tax=Sinomicrobium weinanense TaxID=2842200 RepID=A0A926JNF6_9FLAO|nr:TonB-dependent receptor [Sinomicrobium weinanense]MBC9794520.1 TonB-dependent receptor [Sinomicrobium weinanense]MBU3124427.1 TonB-dependent receptor [Sinomicrobium weinanense]
MKSFLTLHGSTLVKSCLCVLALHFCTAWGYGYPLQDTGQIKGTVSTPGGAVIPFATVGIVGGKQTQADENGRYVLSGIRPGTHRLRASYFNSNSDPKEIVLKEGEVLEVNLVLEEYTQALNEVLLVGDKYRKLSKKASEYVARMPLEYMENPQVYNVVDKELIQEQVALTLEEAFINIPGAAPAKTGAGMPAFFSRGFLANYNFRDGMVTSLATTVDLAIVDRVETIKGPSSTLFGGTLTSFGGIVNYVTKKPYEEFGGEVSFQLGSWDLGRLTADINTPLNEDKSVLFRLNTAVQKENFFQNQGYANTYVFAPSFIYKPSDRLTFTLGADFQLIKGTAYAGWNVTGDLQTKNIKNLKLDYDQSLINNSLASNRSSGNILLQADYKISENWTSQTKLAWSNGAYNDLYNFINSWTSDNTVSRAIGVYVPDKTGRTQLQQNFIGDFKLGRMKNRLLLGLDYMNDYRDIRYKWIPLDVVDINSPINEIGKQSVDTLISQQAISSVRIEQNTYSLYVSDMLDITDQLMVMASLRADKFVKKSAWSGPDEFDQLAFSPKFGVVFQPVKEQVSVFVNYMNGFKNLDNVIYPDGTSSDFEPQQANQWEGGIKVKLFGDKLSATASYYDIRVSDALYTEMREVDGANGPQAFRVQGGKQQSKGVEAEVIANPFPGLHLVAGYSYNDNEYTEGDAAILGKRTTGAPEQVGNLWASYTVLQGALEGFGIGAGGQMVSEVYVDGANEYTLPSYTKLNTTLFYNRSKYRISLKLDNLLDEEYWISDGVYFRPQKPLNFIAGISFKF